MSKKSFYIYFCTLFVGIGLGYSTFTFWHTHPCLPVYKFINVDIICRNVSYVIKKIGYAELVADLHKYIELQKKEGRIQSGSVYFRDLVSGPTFGVNAEDQFAAASLLKLPLAFVFLELAHERPELLKKQVVLEDEAQSLPYQDINPEDAIKRGQAYSIENLIYRMLIYSDNRATELLIKTLEVIMPNENLLVKELHQMGLIPENFQPDYEINTRQYAGLFRLLYNVSYLEAGDSEKILEILSKSAFKEGIRAGIPENIVVVNKFGERATKDGALQLHDCGIIYFPENPYILCVMTRGGLSLDSSSKIITDISKMVWTELNSRRIK